MMTCGTTTMRADVTDPGSVCITLSAVTVYFPQSGRASSKMNGLPDDKTPRREKKKRHPTPLQNSYTIDTQI